MSWIMTIKAQINMKPEGPKLTSSCKFPPYCNALQYSLTVTNVSLFQLHKVFSRESVLTDSRGDLTHNRYVVK